VTARRKTREPAPGTTRGPNPDTLHPGVIAGAVVASAAIVHGAALTGGFAADDFDFLLRARGLDPTSWTWARPLPGVIRWSVFTAVFGVHPLPHLLLALGLHVGSALAIAHLVRELGYGGRAALFGGVAMAASAVAYTSTHWASGLGEVMATFFVAATLVGHLASRKSDRRGSRWIAGACAAGAVLSKESAVLLPVACLAFDRLACPRGPGRGALREIAVFGGSTALAIAALWVVSPHVAGEAYAMTASPAAMLANLLTYGAWLVRLLDPIRDRSATPQPELVAWGAGALLAWGALAARERWREHRLALVGLAIFLLLLAPVIPLVHHTYLYYMLAPLTGACLAAGAAWRYASGRLAPGLATSLLVVLCAAYVANEAVQVRARMQLSFGDIVVDRVAREARLVQNTIGDLRSAGVTRDTIALVSPFPQRAVNATAGTMDSTATTFSETAYIPLVGALRGGRVIPLYLPRVTVLGVGTRFPREWERARVFRFDNDGHLADLGRGAPALDSLSRDYIDGGRWDEARGTLERLIESGHDGPEVRWRLGAALAALGEEQASIEQAQVLLARWPDSERAKLLRANATRAGMRTPAAAR